MKTFLYILIGLGCLIFSAFMGPTGIMALVHDQEFDDHGIRTPAVITRVWIVHNGRSNGKTCWATLIYQPGAGASRETNIRVSPPTYDDLKVDQRIAVKYLPANEGDIRIDLPAEVEWHWMQDAGTILAGVVIFAITLFLGWVALPRSRQSWEDAAVKADLAGRDHF